MKMCLVPGRTFTTLAVAFALTSAPSLAATPYFVETCSGYMGTAMPNAVQAALARVGSCLTGLNASMASSVKKLLKSGKVTIACSDKNVKGHGHTSQKGTSVRIEIDTPNFSGDAYEPSSSDNEHDKKVKADNLRNALSELLFHEFIHAIDKTGKYINSAEIHNSGAGVPDPVYGCGFACFPGAPDKPGSAMMNAGKKLIIPTLAERKSFTCPYGDAFAGPCKALRRYANLCYTGKPVALKFK